MQPCRLLAGTEDGLVLVDVDSRGNGRLTRASLEGNAVRAIAVDPRNPDRVLIGCGLRGWGMHLSEDGGQTFSSVGFEDRWVWGLAIDHGNPERVLVGTEPPMLFESRDGGRTFRDFPAIDQVPGRERWTFFHPPFHAGHVHAISITPERPGRIIAGIEHGGLLVSYDDGVSWEDRMPGADMHVTAIDPLESDRIYAGAGNGLFVSQDGGSSWSAVDRLRGKYVHGIEIHPVDPDQLFVYVDSRGCPVYRSVDRGTSWSLAGKGLPASRPADPIRIHPTDRSILFYAGDDDRGSRIYRTDDDGDDWTDIGVSLPKVWRLNSVAV